jgi:TatD DNase family protein
MSVLVDCHCHLDFDYFEDKLDKVIENAIKNNVKIIITNGLNSESNIKSLEIAKKYKIVKSAFGFYPFNNSDPADQKFYKPLKERRQEFKETIKFIKKNKDECIAIGEVGLDFKNVTDEKEKEEQINNFKEIIKLSEKLKKPLIVHTRKAEEECLDLLDKSTNNKIILHCFSGKKKLVIRALKDKKYYFSIPTNVVKSQQFQEIVKLANLSQILTETDAPFLGPVKGEYNEPANIIYSIKKIAELKLMDVQELTNVIFMNYQKIFSMN